MRIYAHFTGWGMAVPEKKLTNEELSTMVDTNDQWIRERTGIESRYVAGPDETTASLATEAAIKALEVANLPPNEVDLVIVATSTPEHLFPSTASIVQDRIGAVNAGAFDLLAACTGFIYALNMATQSIRTGEIKSAVIIGAETFSRVVDWTDRSTCILFGDGAGAYVLQGHESPGGIISAITRSDGSGSDLLIIPGGGSKIPATLDSVQLGKHFIKMNGREVFRFATRVMVRSTEEALEIANWNIEDISLIIPHQANMRIIDAAARGLKLPLEKFAINVQEYGNTSAASIPIATVEAFDEGRLQKNDKIILVGFGAGLAWGALTAIWTGPFPVEKPVNFTWQRVWAAIRSRLLRLYRRIEGIIWGRGKSA